MNENCETLRPRDIQKAANDLAKIWGRSVKEVRRAIGDYRAQSEREYLDGIVLTSVPELRGRGLRLRALADAGYETVLDFLETNWSGSPTQFGPAGVGEVTFSEVWDYCARMGKEAESLTFPCPLHGGGNMADEATLSVYRLWAAGERPVQDVQTDIDRHAEEAKRLQRESTGRFWYRGLAKRRTRRNREILHRYLESDEVKANFDEAIAVHARLSDMVHNSTDGPAVRLSPHRVRASLQGASDEWHEFMDSIGIDMALWDCP